MDKGSSNRIDEQPFFIDLSGVSVKTESRVPKKRGKRRGTFALYRAIGVFLLIQGVRVYHIYSSIISLKLHQLRVFRYNSAVPLGTKREHPSILGTILISRGSSHFIP